jgi:O-antigen/teichoic acid export membrane protein
MLRLSSLVAALEENWVPLLSFGKKIIRILPAKLAAKIEVALAFLSKASAAGDDQSAAQRMALTAFIVRIFSAAIAFFSHVLFARLIGQFDYGIYAFVWVIVVIFGNLSCLGFHTTLIRYLPIYRESSASDHYRGLAFASQSLAIGISITLALFGLITLHYFGHLVESYYLVPVALGLLTLPMIALGDMLDGTSRANGWAMMAMKYTYLIRPLLIIAAMVLATAMGFDRSATTAMQAALVATAITTLWQLLSVKRHLVSVLPSGDRRYDYRIWLRFAVPLFVIDGIGFLLTNADVIIVGLYMPPDQVGVYFAAAKIIVLMQFVFFAVKAAAGPRYSNLIARNDSQGLISASQQIARWSFWPSLAMGLSLLLLGPWLLGLFGQGFSAGYSLIAILFVGFLIKSAIGPAETLLNMAGKQFVCLWLYAITFASNIILNITLIPDYGLRGAATATTLAMALETLLLFAATRKLLGIWLSPLPKRYTVAGSTGGLNGK